MDYILFALPILPGKSEQARRFLHELEHQRKAQYAASERKLNIPEEVWALQQLPSGEAYVVYFKGQDIAQAFQTFAQSRDEFDVWFKQQLKETSGLDLNTPPAAAPSEVLSVYTAG